MLKQLADVLPAFSGTQLEVAPSAGKLIEAEDDGGETARATGLPVRLEKRHEGS